MSEHELQCKRDYYATNSVINNTNYHLLWLICNWRVLKTPPTTWLAWALADCDQIQTSLPPKSNTSSGTWRICLQFKKGELDWFQPCCHLHHTSVPKYLICQLLLFGGKGAASVSGGARHWSEVVSRVGQEERRRSLCKGCDEVSPLTMDFLSHVRSFRSS